MAQKSGKPWSGQNKIPTINQFMANLDKDKAERDKQIDSGTQQKGLDVKHQDVMPHKNQERMKDAKEVSDPVTGGQVMIADVGKEHMENADNPMVSHTLLSIDLTSDCHGSFQYRTRIWENTRPFLWTRP